MDESCSTNYAYLSCCVIILFNLIYLLFTLIKLFIQHQRRKRLFPERKDRQMTENINEITTTSSSRMATRSTTTAAAVASAKSTIQKSGSERLAQLYPHITEDIRLPMKWNGKEKASTLVLQQNDLVVTYKGEEIVLR